LFFPNFAFEILRLLEFGLLLMQFFIFKETSLLKGEKSKDFSEVLEQVLGLGSITREKFFTILEIMNKKNLSRKEFFKLLEIMVQQQQPPS